MTGAHEDTPFALARELPPWILSKHGHVCNDSPLITIESVHDVVFFPFAQIQLGYLLRDATGGELFVTEVGITEHDNPQTLRSLGVNTSPAFRNNPS
jgi:hypothetical protein